jgi:hypothetical protein
MRPLSLAILLVLIALCSTDARAQSATYEVGPGKPYANIGDVPWESLQPGDTVLIHWRSTPYKEKWVICRRGTASAPITVRGVPGPSGELPVIDGNGATTRLALDYWSEQRGVIKIGGASVPADTLPAYITIEKLDVRSARPPYTFVDDSGASQSYVDSASAIYVEKGENITIRDCTIRDSGNGLFVASSDAAVSRDILVDGNYIVDNGIEGSIYQHNNYTAAIGITFQNNRFGPLRAGCPGNNLKDRSAGLVVRYNWIEGGNRQLDLVDGEDSSIIRNDPAYRTTYVYGNVLVEPDAAGNRQIVHYGGDSGAAASYRKGTLHFYNNTLVSYRTDRTTLFRLSTNDERCEARNNVFYVTAAGSSVSLVDASGVLVMRNNWLKPGWVSTFGTLTGTIDNAGTVTGSSPGFVNEAARDFRLAPGSACVDAGTSLLAAVLPAHDVVRQYVAHQSSEQRPRDTTLDIGAYEAGGGTIADLAIATTSLPAGTAGAPYSASLSATGGVPPYAWSVVAGGLPPGVSLDAATGALSGTPTVAGTWAFTVGATDAQSPADSATAALSIAAEAAPVDPLAITTTSLPNARRNRNYSQTLQATGGVAPYTWSVVSGSLPPGLSLDAATGTIAGRATQTGTWSFTVQARDVQSPAATDTQPLTLRVRK